MVTGWDIVDGEGRGGGFAFFTIFAAIQIDDGALGIGLDKEGAFALNLYGGALFSPRELCDRPPCGLGQSAQTVGLRLNPGLCVGVFDIHQREADREHLAQASDTAGEDKISSQ